MNKRLCRNCGNREEEHFTDQWITHPFWCIRNGRAIYNLLLDIEYKQGSRFDNICFHEMNNLEYLEWKSE